MHMLKLAQHLACSRSTLPANCGATRSCACASLNLCIAYVEFPFSVV